MSRAMVKSQYCGVGLWYITAPGVSSTCHVSWLQHYCRGGGWGWLMRPNCGVQQWSSPLNTAARVNSNWLQFITPHLVPHRFVPVGWSKAKRSNKREERGHGKGEPDNYCKAPGSFLYAIQVFNSIYVRQILNTGLPLMYYNLFDQIWPTVLTPAPCPPDLLHTG